MKELVIAQSAINGDVSDMDGFIGLAVGTLIGVAATYFLDVRKDRAERRKVQEENQRARRRSRESVATALLFDMKRLEFQLHELFNSETPSRAVTQRPALFFDDLRGETRWFASSTIPPVAEVYRQADHVFSTIAGVRGREGAHPPDLEYTIRTLCGFALRSIPSAAKVLMSEGGTPPESLVYPTVTFPTLPEVPPKMFPDVSVEE